MTVSEVGPGLYWVSHEDRGRLIDMRYEDTAVVVAKLLFVAGL